MVDAETRAIEEQQKDDTFVYTEDGEKCILGQAEKHATRFAIFSFFRIEILWTYFYK
jgi:hypothetical protein